NPGLALWFGAFAAADPDRPGDHDPLHPQHSERAGGASVMARPRPAAPLSAKLVTLLAFLLLYIPLAVLVVYSFLAPINGPGSELDWSLEWYARVFSNQQVLDSLRMSLWV